MTQDLTALLDERYELEEQIKALEKQYKELSNNIVLIMMTEGIKRAEGSNGLGYTTGCSTRYQILPEVYRYLDKKGLLQEFAQEPKVTKTGIDKLLKAEKLSYADMAEIEKGIIAEQGEYTLRKQAVKEKV